MTLTATAVGGEEATVTKQVEVDDLMIVSVGDSIASGEGNPDIESPGSRWQLERCHRSAFGGPAQAARWLEAADARTSVTLLHLACSGGRIEGDNRLTAEAGMVVDAARRAGDLPPGARGLAAVRPEHIGVSRREPDSRANSAEGRVVAIVMLGDSQEYVVRLADGQEVFSRVPRTAADAPGDGERVWVSWSRDHATLYPYEELTAGVQAIGRRRGNGARAAS